MRVLVQVLFLAFLQNVFSQELHVYASAHPDDWQLFMNPNVYHSLQNEDTKVMFLHTTAGDAGHGTENNAYYLAREEGSFRAIRFLVNAKNGGKGLGADVKQETLMANSHPILKYTYDNAIVIFMRLPDGNYYGPGYQMHDSTSLRKLYTAEKNKFTAIDKSTSYSSGEDLENTLADIIKSEATNSEEIQLNIAETDTIRNPGDHSDHRFTSLFLQNVARKLNLKTVRLYEEYVTSNKPHNVFPDDFMISAGCWGATASGLSDMGHYSTWDKVHNAWIGRQYFREVDLNELKE